MFVVTRSDTRLVHLKLAPGERQDGRGDRASGNGGHTLQRAQSSVLAGPVGTSQISELGRPQQLQGSATAIVVGILTATYGSLGLGQALQNALNVAWSVPRNKRPNPLALRFKSLLLLIITGLAVLAITVVSTLGSETEVFGPRADGVVTWGIRLVNVILVGLVLTGVFRLAAARRAEPPGILDSVQGA